MSRPAVAVLATLLVLTAAMIPAQAQDGGRPLICSGDRTGDQRAPRNPDRPDEPADVDGASDLLEVCVAGDGTLTATTAAPTGLDSDPRWRDGASALTIGVRLDDDDDPFHLILAPGPDGQVTATAVDGSTVTHDTCPVTVEGPLVTAGPGCLPGGATPVGLQASLRLHTDPQREYAPVTVDVVPDGGGFVTADGDRLGAPAGPTRLAGSDRIGTAVAIAQGAFPDGAATVYLARADDLADAVGGTALRDGPILLVPRCGALPSTVPSPVPPPVAAEITRLDPVQVVALGGPDAVCDDLLDAAAEGRPTDRLAGSDRHATAAVVAARAFPGGADEVFLARGDDLADAVAAGTLDTGPLLLVPGCGPLPDGAALAIARTLPKRIIALGGQAAVCDEVLQAAAEVLAHSPDLLRLGGADRFATAAAIAARRSPGGAPLAYLARADQPADAVAAGTLTGGPVLLVPACGPLPAATAEAIGQQVRPDRVVAVGGPGGVCDAVLAAAQAARPGAEPQ